VNATVIYQNRHIDLDRPRGKRVSRPMQGYVGWITSFDQSRSEVDDMPQKDHGRSIKDDAQYEKLRKQGMSKEKAARIANTPRRTAGKRGGSSPTYEEWSKDELYEKARQVGIEGRSSMDKKQLISALRNH
jgi:hypothetical protein